MAMVAKYKLLATSFFVLATVFLLSRGTEARVVKVLLSEKQMKNFLASEELWGRACSPAYPQWGDYTFDSPKPKFSELTSEELGLIFGYTDENGRNSWAWPVITQWVDNPKYPWVNDEFLRRIYGPDSRIPLLSPVTERSLEFQHREFSAGNAYIKLITEPEYLELLKDYYQEKGGGLSSSQKVYYIRLYGKNQVIWENLWFNQPGPVNKL